MEIKPLFMTITNVKNNVYEVIIGTDYKQFFSELELIEVIKYNDIADVQKTSLGYLVYTDWGALLPSQYIRTMSENAQWLLEMTLIGITPQIINN